MSSRRPSRPGPSRPGASGPAAPAVDTAVVEQAVAELRRRLQGAGRRDVAAQLHRELGDDVPLHGLKPADTHRIGLELLRRHRTGGLPFALAAGDLLFNGNLEEGQVGAQLVGALARLVTGGDFERFDAWAATLTNPHTADALGLSCIAPAMAAKPSIGIRLQTWAKDESPWRRRAALAAFIPLVREGRFLTDALDVAALVMTDPHPAVREAVATVMVEASRLQAGRVAEFLAAWKDRAPADLLRPAAAKLSPEQRAAVLGE
jgi:3-methyladenine DNA glycosylase AlkD